MEESKPLTARERCSGLWGRHWRGWVIFLAPIILIPLLFIEPNMEFRCAYVVFVVAIYWATEVLPLGITSLIPIVLFPALGIMSTDAVCKCFFKDSFMLFFGGLVVALSVEYSNLHKRVAISVILLVGCSPRRLHFAFLMVAMIVSMWISNSATTAMMCPVIKAVLEELAANNMAELYDESKRNNPNDPPYPSKIALCYYLGVAFTSSIGGLGTLIGTGTNMVFKGIYEGYFPGADEVKFLTWSAYTLPIVFTDIFFCYLIWQWQFMGLFRPKSPEALAVVRAHEGKKVAEEVISERKKELGRFTTHEIQIGLMFILMSCLFVFRKPGFMTGWADILNDKPIKSSFPVILLTLLLFLLPVNYYFMKYFVCRRPAVEGRAGSLLTWEFLHNNIPWGLVVLIGSGFTLSEGMKVSGLAQLISKKLQDLQFLPAPVLQIICLFTAIVLSSFASNMASCNVLMPVLLELSVMIKQHPAYLAMPATLALSYAFAFPVSTPPNAIVAGYANIRTKDMFLAGLGPGVVGLLVTFCFSQTWIYVVFPEIRKFPEWASDHHNITK